jgi:hypothetical protein
MRTDSVGYHYTSYDCWTKIKREGLLPYSLCKPEFRAVIGSERTIGIWIWQERFSGVSHTGSIIWQIGDKNTAKVVLLKVRYNDADVLRGKMDGREGKVQISHTGNINRFYHHTGIETAYIVTKGIPPECIKLIGKYDLAKAFRR